MRNYSGTLFTKDEELDKEFNIDFVATNEIFHLKNDS